MRRAIALLLLLIGLAAVAFGLLQSFADNCNRVERESDQSIQALAVCMQTIGCHFDYADLVAIARQKRAAMRCEVMRQARDE